MTTPKNSTTATRVEHTGHLRWIRVGDILVNPRAQQELRPGWANEIAANFDPDKFGYPTLSARGDKYNAIDGQHRVAALLIMGWQDQLIQCHVHEGLTEEEEAELFLSLNHRKAVSAFNKFRVGVTAGREEETDIERIVLANGLKITKSKAEGSVSAVSSLRKVYKRGPVTLGRALRLANGAYGDFGLSGEIIDGFGLLCDRYNGEIDDQTVIAKLSSTRGGFGTLSTIANQHRKSVGKPMPDCIAAAAVDLINKGGGRRKLREWWATA